MATMGLQGIERGLERMVEGVFARAFRSSLRPIELGRKLVREMDDHRSVDVKDHAQFTEIHDALVRELCDAAREYARDEQYTFMGPVQVELNVDNELRPGRFTVISRLHEGAGGAGAGALVLPSGERITLADKPVLIGRLPECEITLSDPNVSRRHAEVRPFGTGFLVVDLGSTNGTKVNGMTVSERQLQDGDSITVGATRLRFDAS